MSSAISAAVVIFSILMGITSVFGILVYVLTAISYYTISKNRGYDKPWLAWIPVANDYLMGAVADDINRRKGKASSFRIWLPVLYAATLVLSIIVCVFSLMNFSSGLGQLPYYFENSGFYKSFAYSAPSGMFVAFSSILSILSSLVSIALMVMTYIVVYKTFQDYTPNNAVLFLLLSIFISITYPFLLLSIRNKPAISIYGHQDAKPQWNWAPPQQPYGPTPPPPYYGQGYAAPPPAESQQNNYNPSSEAPSDDQDKPQQ